MLQHHEHTHLLSCSSSSTVHSVFPPLLSHLRHFSCHSWKQNIASRHICNLAPLTKWSRNFCTDCTWAAFSFSSPFFLLCTTSRNSICFVFFPQSSNSTVVRAVFPCRVLAGRIGLTSQTVSLFKVLLLLCPVLLIYPTSFSFLRYQLKLLICI